LADGDYLSDKTVVARALFEPQWDAKQKRGTPSSFKKNNTSVTRFNGNNLDEVIALLKRDVENKPNVTVKAIGIIRVSKIKSIGMNRTSGDPILFQVKESPTENNEYHAEVIPYNNKSEVLPKLPNSISSTITKGLLVVVVDEHGKAEECLKPKD